MATDTAYVTPPARDYGATVVNTLRKTVNYNDAGISAGLAFANSLPIGAFILSVDVEIVTAFNGGTDVLTVGTNSTSYNDMVAAGDVDETATGVNRVTRANGRSLAATAEKTPYAKYTTAGTATTGQAVIVITYAGGSAN